MPHECSTSILVLFVSSCISWESDDWVRWLKSDPSLHCNFHSGCYFTSLTFHPTTEFNPSPTIISLLPDPWWYDHIYILMFEQSFQIRDMYICTVVSPTAFPWTSLHLMNLAFWSKSPSKCWHFIQEYFSLQLAEVGNRDAATIKVEFMLHTCAGLKFVWMWREVHPGQSIVIYRANNALLFPLGSIIEDEAWQYFHGKKYLDVLSQPLDIWLLAINPSWQKEKVNTLKVNVDLWTEACLVLVTC